MTPKCENVDHFCACALSVRVCKSSLSVPLRTYVTSGFLEIFISRQKRVAHIVLSTGVLKLDFRPSRKVAFTFGALRSDIGVCRVPDFGQLFRAFLQEKSLFCLLAENTF